MPQDAGALDGAAFGPAFVSRWIASALDVTPLTAADRRAVETGLAAVHEGLGLRWHGNVVWVSSPQELRRALASAPGLMRGSYLAMARRQNRAVQLVRLGRALSRVTMVLGYAVIAAMAAFLPAYYAGSLVDSLSGHQLDHTSGGLLVIVLLVTVLAGLLAVVVLARAALDSSRQVFAPIGTELEQRLRVLLTRGRRSVLPEAGEPVRQALSELWPQRLLEGAWTEGHPVLGFHRDGVIGDPTSVGAAHQAALSELGRSGAAPHEADVLAGLLDVRRALVWVPYAWLTVVLEPPAHLFTERAGRRLRLHRDDGPAVVWPDGQVEFYLHGVAIPAELAAREPTVRELHTQRSTEVRRVLIEREGWARYVERAALRLISAAPDPGNPGRQLRLYRAPPGVFDSGRLLLMANGSPDRCGRVRYYGELVPDGLDDPVEAAAWQYGVPADVYRGLVRRT